MQPLWKQFEQEIFIWLRGAIPGITVLGLVIIARLMGWLQSLEWTTLDLFLRLRPSEAMDERIILVGINDEDIHRVGTYPISDREIAILIRTLQKYKPRVIGLDNVRDIPVEPGHDELVRVFRESKNLIGIEKVLLPPIKPPKELPSERVGFSDAIPDSDGQYRRTLLGMPTPQGYKFSLSLRLAETYLARDGVSLENGIRDLQAMRFGTTEIPRFFSDTGGYVGTDARGVQILLNYRNGKENFRILSLNDIKTGQFNPQWIRDRIVLIGITAPSAPDLVNTAATRDAKIHGQIYGVEFQAHALSQIVSAVKDGRPLLKTWSDAWEYVWIAGWGILAIYIGRLTQSALQNLVAIGIISLFLIGIGYVSLILGWWLAIAPVLLILAINGVGLSAFAFYQHDRALRLQIRQRQDAIDEAFTDIHNGPLQQLAYLSRSIQSKDLPQEQLLGEVQKLNSEIREIFEHLKQEALSPEKSIRLESGLKLDLERPIHELFYEVTRSTQKRDFPCFRTLKISITDFNPIECNRLTIERKRQLCRFLEEALCNVGKHAQGVTRIKVTGIQKDDWYILSIQDNGVGIVSEKENQGTKDAQKLAQELGGKFQRQSISPQGVLCKLTFQVSKSKVKREKGKDKT
ncbi:MAG: CHASE2 domain-containing protein [Hydrococcus sp. C42_A2020_068]|nr:CHASE2 domain-containing protein [Hydrococcus sp. C42_A2020_068]